MPSILYRVIPKQVVPALNGGGSLWIAKGIDITGLREATALLRVHQGTNVPGATNNGLQALVFPDAPTPEDATDFLPNAATALITLPTTNTFINGGAQIGTFFWQAINSAAFPQLPAFLRVQLVWGTGTTTGQAVISMDIVAKS